MASIAPVDIAPALSGETKALEDLVLELMPVIRSRVLQTLIRLQYRARGRSRRTLQPIAMRTQSSIKRRIEPLRVVFSGTWLIGLGIGKVYFYGKKVGLGLVL